MLLCCLRIFLFLLLNDIDLIAFMRRCKRCLNAHHGGFRYSCSCGCLSMTDEHDYAGPWCDQFNLTCHNSWGIGSISFVIRFFYSMYSSSFFSMPRTGYSRQAST